MDEVFVDLCRQMLRREGDSQENFHGGDEDYSKYDNHLPPPYRNKKRGKRRRKDGTPKCVIL